MSIKQKPALREYRLISFSLLLEFRQDNACGYYNKEKNSYNKLLVIFEKTRNQLDHNLSKHHTMSLKKNFWTSCDERNAVHEQPKTQKSPSYFYNTRTCTPKYNFAHCKPHFQNKLNNYTLP